MNWHDWLIYIRQIGVNRISSYHGNFIHVRRLIVNSFSLVRLHATTAMPSAHSIVLAVYEARGTVAFLFMFRVFLIRVLLEVVVTGAAFTPQFIDHLLVVVAKDFEDFWFDACFCKKLIVGHALAYLVNAVDIFDVLAILRVDLDQPFHQLSL